MRGMVDNMSCGFDYEPLPGSFDFGALVRDVDHSSLSDPNFRKSLVDLWHSSGVIVFRNCASNPEYIIDLSKCFGDELIVHPLKEYTVPGYEELVQINAEDQVYVVDGEEIAGWSGWHIDTIFRPAPNRGSLLCGLVLPSRGGNTGFIDRGQAYDRLSKEDQERIAGLEVIYQYRSSIAENRYYTKSNARRRDLSAPQAQVKEREAKDFREVVQPMVVTIPETQRKVLNISPGSLVRIRDMDARESDVLLRRLVDHVEDEAFAYYHEWEHGDLVLWDNWRMLHRSAGCPPDEERQMVRTTIAAPWALGREMVP